MAIMNSVRAEPAEARGKQRYRSPFDKLRVNVLPILLVLFVLHLSPAAQASVQQEVYVTGHVQSFGGYTFTEAVSFDVSRPGQQEIGRVIVDGVYNGEYPWIMRVYTDNLHFAGITGSVRFPSPAGLVSKDGLYVIPLSIYSPAYGPNVWRRIPDVSEPGYLPYEPKPEPGETTYTDCVLMGIDPRNGSWVAGGDGLLYTFDDNALGDTTVATPFELILQADVPPAGVKGEYDAVLYIEISPAP